MSTRQIVGNSITQDVNVIHIDVNCEGTSYEGEIFVTSTRDILSSSSLVFDKNMGGVHVYVGVGKSREHFLRRCRSHCSKAGSDIISDPLMANPNPQVLHMYAIAVTYTNILGSDCKQAEDA